MSIQKHVFEYAKTGRAKCHGPCNGQYIAKGTLRYGKKYTHPQYGECISWMHWECSGSILGRLASVRLDDVPGFRFLLSADQERIRRDVSSRRIGPTTVDHPSSDEPLSSQTREGSFLSSSQTGGPSKPLTRQARETSLTLSSRASAGQKRRAEFTPSQTLAQSHPIVVDDESDEYFDNNEDEIKDELYISLPAKIVGVQYYKGMVGPGEEVSLVREPHNKYDRNAIQVLNISKMQVGHMPRNIASKLAPLIDRNYVTAEGVIHEGNLGKFEYSISMTLKIYGASFRRPELEPLLVWATPKQRGFTDAMRPAGYQSGQSLATTADYQSSAPSPANYLVGPSGSSITPSQRKAQEARLDALRKAEELRSILSSLEKVNDEGRRASLLDIVCPTEDVLDLPQHPSPPSIASGELKVDLLRHQSQALLWCIERESPLLPQKESDRPVQFWQYKAAPGRSQGYYLNIATKTPQETRPLLGKGGLMADAMGLGKTLTMLSLILTTKKAIPESFSNATLIIVPLSVLSNWKTQILNHFSLNSLKYHLYYETGRNLSSEQLRNYDVVITTYQVVTQDFAAKDNVTTKADISDNPRKKRRLKSRDGLFDVKWKRIILDEGHTIRNPKTKIAIAVRELEAERRWVVTGTPIINSPKDLGSILQFLRICTPLDNEDYFKRLLIRPLAQGVPEGPELLRALMSHVCIRRTKEMQNSKGEPLISLPPVEMTLVPVQLDPATRDLYNEVEALSQQRFATFMEHQGESGRSLPANVLSLLTRLRQITLHPGLIPHNYLEQLRSMSVDDSAKPLPAIPVTPADRLRLQTILAHAVEDREECPICFDITNDPRITPCAHIYCFACISEVLSRDSKCPMDRRIINSSDLIEPPPPTDLTQAPPPVEPEDASQDGSSAKIDQLVHLLQLTPKTEKSLIFSQFTGFLDKIAEALEKHQISYVRFDGQMSARRRQEALEKFSKPLVDTEKVVSVPLPRQRRRRSSSKAAVDPPDFDSKDDDFLPDDCGDSDDSFISEDDLARSRKGKGKSKAKSKKKRLESNQYLDNLDDYENPVVMLISLKAGALGLNLTVANNVYLMDPWWQEGIESQAIDRCNRIGQTKPVHVYQLVAEDTIEAKVLEIQERKKNLIKQAFSGVKSTETQRQKKEARLQDLIELLGARRNNAT